MDLRISSKILLMENGIDTYPKSKLILKLKGNINESSLGDEAKPNNNNPFGSHFLKNVVNSSPSSSGARSISSDGEANSIDDDLTNLTWLHDGNLLQNLCQAQNIKENRLSERGIASKPTDFDNEESSLDDPNSRTLEEKKTDGRVPYNPLIDVNMKPPYSFSCLIFMAIEESPNKALPVKEIYSWIILHFPYFRNAPIGWKNSVRHNLSLNKCFCKVDKNKSQNMGKGSLWCVDADFRPNLLQALRRAPLCPFSECNDKELADIVSGGECDSLSQSSNLPVKTPTDLFPFLSKRHYDSTDIDKEVDVASTMLNLKNSMPQRNFTDSSKHKETKKKRYLNLGSNAEFVRSAKTRKTETTSNNATPYVDHTYSASTQIPQLENVRDLHPELSPRPDTERPRLHIINNNNINNDAKIIVNHFDAKMKEEESSQSPVPLEESYDERVVAKNKFSQSVIVDGSKLRMRVKREEEERSLEEGAHALLSLANMARMHNNFKEID